MGVPGLWDVLRESGTVVSIAKLASIDGFQHNKSMRRAYRVGVDVSIWFEHAKVSKGGENPFLRALFFDLANLSKMPIIPLFVFDGRSRPKVKRGSKMGKSGSHPSSKDFKLFLDAFGMEWREAPGEAEAELAYLNQEGHIDAVMTDDCDAFIFGARTVFKNPSASLSGNKANPAQNSDNKSDKFHTWIYKSSDIESNPRVGLNRGGLLLFALLAGGDYDKGVPGIGKATASRLCRWEFGEELLLAYQNLPAPAFNEFLGLWRTRINKALRETVPRTTVVLPDTFPKLDVLQMYAKPIHSGNKLGAGSSNNLAIRDRKSFDIGQIAHLCEEHFEWGSRPVIIERFSRLLWPGAVMQVLRRAALEMDENERMKGYTAEIGTPSSLVQKVLGKTSRADMYANAFVNQASTQNLYDGKHIIARIVGSREHTSTDGILEYRVEILPHQLVQITNAGIRGTREAPLPKETVKPREPHDPHKPLRLWIPAVILGRVHPTLVEQFIHEQSGKKQKKAKGKNRASSPLTNTDLEDEYSIASSPPRDHTMVIPTSSTSQRQRGSSSEIGPSRNASFMFTFKDPDLSQFDEEVHEGDEVHDNDDFTDDRPRTYFEALCDQIITRPAKSSKTRKRKAASATLELPAESVKKRRQPCGLLDLLDDII